MKRVCFTGIKPLGRNLKITRSGAVVLVGDAGRQEVIWWPPIEVSKEIMKTYDEWVYFISDDGYLMGTFDPPEFYMDVE